MANRGIRHEKLVKVALAVFEHGDIRSAAKASGVPERTVYRWASTGEFKTALRDCQRAAMNASLSMGV